MLCLRAALLLQGGVSLVWVWMLPADLLAAALITVIAPLLRYRWILLITGLGVGVLGYAAGEHLSTHGSLFRLAHAAQAAQSEFLGSTLPSTRFMFLPIHLGVALFWLWAISRQQRRAAASEPTPSQRSSARVAFAVILLLGYYLVVPSATHPANNLIASMMIQVPDGLWRSVPVLSAQAARPQSAPAPELPRENVFFLQQTRNAPDPVRPNVLLIMIEGLSGAYLPSVARHHGLRPELALPELDALLDRFGFVIYPNMLSQQRQTNRGSYALICGDFPEVVTAVPKMTRIAEAGLEIDCLPRRLAENGYRTAYVQAAPLDFMHKRQFMPLAGYEHQMGREDFLARGLRSEGWGPGDVDFLAAAVDRIRLLAASDEPWFATLLNVGTHHPFHNSSEDEPVLPDGARPLPERRIEAFRVMVEALEQTLESLHEDGLLDDTLVILTADEAGGFQEHSGRELVLHNNFGMLALRLPDRVPFPGLAPRDRIVAQVDIPLTVLDLLGIARGSGMVGRSLLDRPVERRRGLLFGDTYLARSYFLYEDGELIDCDESLLRCRVWRFDPLRLFGSLQRSEQSVRLSLEARQRIVEEAARIRVMPQ
jgi:hypothetical protein